MNAVKGFAVKKVLVTAVVAGAILFSPLRLKVNPNADFSNDKQKQAIVRVFEKQTPKSDATIGQHPKSDPIVGVQPRNADINITTGSYRERKVFGTVTWRGQFELSLPYSMQAWTYGIPVFVPPTYTFPASLDGTPYASVKENNFRVHVMINLPLFDTNNVLPSLNEIKARLTLAGEPAALVNATPIIIAGESTIGWEQPSKAVVMLSWNANAWGQTIAAPYDVAPKLIISYQPDNFTAPPGIPATNAYHSFPNSVASINGSNDITYGCVFAGIGGFTVDPYQNSIVKIPPSGLRISSIQSVGINQNTGKVPANYSLSQNYPNPFNSTTTISYSVPKKEKVSLKVYNSQGKEEATLVNGTKAPGNYDAKWTSTATASSGVYFYTMTAGNFTETKKMAVVK